MPSSGVGSFKRLVMFPSLTRSCLFMALTSYKKFLDQNRRRQIRTTGLQPHVLSEKINTLKSNVINFDDFIWIPSGPTGHALY